MNVTAKYEMISENFWEFFEENKELHESFGKHYADCYAPGKFDVKTKRLMSMVGAIVSGCEGCIIGQAGKAIDNGATKDEVFEACAVALSLGGTMAGSKISLVVKYIKERGMM